MRRVSTFDNRRQLRITNAGFTRVVHTEPGPIPTFTISAPERISSSHISPVTTLPAQIVLSAMLHALLRRTAQNVLNSHWPHQYRQSSAQDSAPESARFFEISIRGPGGNHHMLQNISRGRVDKSCPFFNGIMFMYSSQNIKPGQCLRHFKRPDGIHIGRDNRYARPV